MCKSSLFQCPHYEIQNYMPNQCSKNNRFEVPSNEYLKTLVILHLADVIYVNLAKNSNINDSGTNNYLYSPYKLFSLAGFKSTNLGSSSRFTTLNLNFIHNTSSARALQYVQQYVGTHGDTSSFTKPS